MQKGNEYHAKHEGSIFDEFNLYKVLNTKRGTAIIHMDGSVSTIIPFTPINSNAFSDDDFDSIFLKFQKVIDDLDSEKISGQFVMTREKAFVDLKKIEKLESFLKPRATFLNDLSSQNELFENKYYISIHCKNKIQRQEKETFSQWLTNKIKQKTNTLFAINKAMDGIDDRLRLLFDTTASFVQLIDRIESKPQILNTKQEYYRLLNKFTRPSKHKLNNIEIDRLTETMESPRQALFSGVRAKMRKSDFTLDDYFHKVYTLDRAPRTVITGRSIAALDSVNAEFLYSVTFRKMAHKESLKAFQYRLLQARMMSGSNEDAMIEDLTLVANEQRIYEHYQRFAFDGDISGIEASCNFVLRIEEETLERMMVEQKLTREEVVRRLDGKMHKDVFQGFGGSEWVSEEFTQWPVFCRLIPGMSSAYEDELKKIILVSSDIPYFFAMYDGKLKGIQHTGVNHYIDMKNNLFPFELMNPNLPAWNYNISGQTGSGKSVLMNSLLTQQLAAQSGRSRPVICILDVGGDRGSFSKFVEIMDGEEINLSGANLPKIQALELKPERSIPNIKKREELAKFFLDEIIQKYKLKYSEKEYKREYENMVTQVLGYYDSKLELGSENETERNLNDLFISYFRVENHEKIEGDDQVDFYGLEPEEKYKKELILKEGNCYPDQSKMNMILAIMEVILSSTAKDMDGFREFDEDFVSDSILTTYEYVGNNEQRYPRFTDLYELGIEGIILKNDDDSTRRFLGKIKQWTTKGKYPMFDQPTSVNLDKDVILADMKGVDSKPKLQMIYTLLLSQLFSDKMYYIKGRRKLIVRDEAWNLMRNDKARQFFVEDLRTARKNGFATVSLSQLPTDYLKPDPQAGRAIMSNMQVNIFCRFEGTKVINEIVQEFNFSEDVANELDSLGVQKVLQPDGSIVAESSKFIMKIGKEVYILKNKLHPFEYYLYSSSEEDNIIIDYYRKKLKDNLKKGEKEVSLEQIIWFISEGKHIGDPDLIKFLENTGQDNALKRVKV